MSYSFAVRAVNKAEARDKIVAEFDRVEIAQPCHATDRAAAQAAALSFLDVLEEDEGRDVQVTVNGWLGGAWQSDGQITSVTQANFGVFASLIPKE